MKPSAEHKPIWERVQASAPAVCPYSHEVLRERFRKVIIGAGYKNPEPIIAEWLEKYLPEPIIAEWLEKYLENIPEFVKMLEAYENDQHKEASEIRRELEGN